MADQGFEIQIAPDRMSVAVVFAACAASSAPVSAAAVIAALRELKLASFDDGLVIEALEGGRVPAEPVVIATGKAAVPSRPGRLDLLVPVADATAATVAKVEAGQAVAEFAPAVPGADGADVFGKPVPPAPGEPAIEVGRNLTAEKGQLLATARGNLRRRGNTVSVEPLLEVQEDDVTAAPVEFDGDAVFRGALREGRVLSITGSATVAGALEAVQLTCGGSVNVKGGLVGKQRGRYTIGGDLRCRFISGGVITVGGDVHVQSEVMNTRLVCAGRVTVAHGPIYGGEVAGSGGILCKTLGHPSGTPTVVEVGEGPAVTASLEAVAAQIRANEEKVRLVRAKVEPLMRNMRQLTAAQKERATELLYEADEVEVRTNRMRADLQREQESLRQKAVCRLHVVDAAHPGVVVRLGGIETVLTMSLKGPFVIATRKRGLVTEVVLVEQGASSCVVLPSRSVQIQQGEKRANPVAA